MGDLLGEDSSQGEAGVKIAVRELSRWARLSSAVAPGFVFSQAFSSSTISFETTGPTSAEIRISSSS